MKGHYDSLHQLLKDFTYVAKLESDSSNILKLVKTGYEDIVSVVDFEDNTSGSVKVKYFTDCGVKGGSLIEATRCAGVEYGMTLNYEAHVSLDSCKEYKTVSIRYLQCYCSLNINCGVAMKLSTISNQMLLLVVIRIKTFRSARSCSRYKF